MRQLEIWLYFCCALIALAAGFTAPARATGRWITGFYTVGSAGNDCLSRIVTSGGAFYTVRFDAASSYPNDCSVLVTNADPWSGPQAAAKCVSVDGTVGAIELWPQQTIELTVIGDNWQVTRYPGPAQPPRGIAYKVYVDPATGTDSACASDGLQVGARAFKTFNHALTLVAQEWFLAYDPITFVCTNNGSDCSGISDSQELHWASHASIPGAEGRAGVVVDCNRGSLSGGVSVFFGNILEMQNCFATNLSAREGAELIFKDGMTFIENNAGAIISSVGGKVYFNGDFNIVGGGDFLLFCTGGGSIGALVHSNNPIMASVLSSVTFKRQTILAEQNCNVAISALMWNLGDHTVLGTKYHIGENSVLEGAANVPGDKPGSIELGGQVR